MSSGAYGGNMKIELKKRYEENVYGAAHTLSVTCNDMDEEVADNEEIVTRNSKTKVRNEDRYIHRLRLNPNNIVGSETMIKSYSQFKTVMNTSFEKMGITSFKINRADFCFNSDDPEDYELFKKLNKLIICCVADLENIKNCYKATDLWSNASLSIAIKSDMLEMENYNKELQSKGITETKNRLEVRSKRVKNALDVEFQQTWLDRLDKAVERFESVQGRYNRELIRIWSEDVEKNPKDRDYISVEAFLMAFKDCLFTRRQLVALLDGMGVKNPEGKAKKFKDKHRVEFYSKTDLLDVVKILKKATRKYFEN